MGKTLTDILKEKNVTWNEPNKKVRNEKELVKFVHEQEEYYQRPERVKEDEECICN